MDVVDYEHASSLDDLLPDRDDDPAHLLAGTLTYVCPATYDGWWCTNTEDDGGCHVARNARDRVVARWRTVPNEA